MGDYRLNLVLDKLESIEKRLDSLEEEIKKVSKHVPFVDSLANSGAVSAVSSLNNLFRSINPYNLVATTEEKKTIEQ